MKLVMNICLFISIQFFISPAHALSCYGLKDDFFIKCHGRACSGEFRAKEVHSFGACARRVIVEPVPEGVIAVLAVQVKNATSSDMENGVYQVSLVHRFYGSLPETASELTEAFKGEGLRVPKINVEKIDSRADLHVIKSGWETQETQQLLRAILYWTIEVSILLGGLFVIVKTFRRFRRSVTSYFDKSAKRLNIAGPLLLQAALFLTTFFLSFASPTGLLLISLVVRRSQEPSA
ncbi:hypothetical protein, partial [Massilia glaciei]|uniref:hypothetical protein n=1 Tax=Massilia glaciei TaxID=1524097 RepID=UPI0011B1D2C8